MQLGIICVKGRVVERVALVVPLVHKQRCSAGWPWCQISRRILGRGVAGGRPPTSDPTRRRFADGFQTRSRLAGRSAGEGASAMLNIGGQIAKESTRVGSLEGGTRWTGGRSCGSRTTGSRRCRTASSIGNREQILELVAERVVTCVVEVDGVCTLGDGHHTSMETLPPHLLHLCSKSRILGTERFVLSGGILRVELMLRRFHQQGTVRLLRF
mmetsp:Transcript_768/g.2152  ORF Transcript_768/g.2152 Transcript_768/m.2152 type:complete len:213 (+) Transcript_768:69-707(+)